MKQYLHPLLILGFLLSSNHSAQSQQILFTIERSLNKDQIVYFLHLDEKGQIKEKDPIQIKWLENERTGELVPINWIKKKFGYGIDVLSHEKNQLTFKFVSYDKKQFLLKKDSLGNYMVFAKINERTMKIHHIYLEIEGGSFWKPNITEVSVTGFNELANSKIIEKFNP
ncbi:DUF4833 domain-containing protein [Cyclobacterium qasimii]|uniref:DUF4833 domain-containing protein n=2 Tax=Cyclobacterium qasimii TaxID=1350429 RepID=S7WY53_9BACT|nr:DUF4833 domain-containing protein [Cyclobacterium qasimii]EPR71684.1 hypothetical protein ADICYQ_0155 [Cyclobacterium qasimii M12-11B]GEO22411.1 hypothetical protein CQA01_29450 [Cyclobacterium qasimii]